MSGRTQSELFVEGNDRYYVSELTPISGTNVLRMDGDEPFGVVVYSDDSGPGNCLALYSGGQCLDQLINVRTPPPPHQLVFFCIVATVRSVRY